MRKRKFFTLICLFGLAFLPACRFFSGDQGEAPSPAALQPKLSPTTSSALVVPTPTLADIATAEPTLAPPTETVPEATATEAVLVRTVVVKVSAANVRSGPGTDNDVVGLVQKDAVLPVLDSDQFGNWLQIQMPDGSAAWIGSTVVVEGGTMAAAPDDAAPDAAAPEATAAATATAGAEDTAPTATTAAPRPTTEPTATETVAPEPTSDVIFYGSAVDPAWYPCSEGQIKGEWETWTYHVPGGAFYDRTYVNVICFDTEEAAEAAGYTRSKH